MPEAYYVLNSVDTDTGDSIKTLKYFRNNVGQIHYGMTGTLGTLNPAATLYIIAHGTATPIVGVKQGPKTRWNASELARQLADDGLPYEQREIELLICEAGASTNTVSGAEKIEKMRQKLLAAKDDGTKNKLLTKIKWLSDNAPSVTNYAHLTDKMLLPFAASLMQAMKDLLYTQLRIISYKHSVAMHFTGGKVWLKNGSGNDWESKPEDRVQWL